MFDPLKTPYTIETTRLVLRCWDPRDAQKMQEAVSESVDSLLPFMPWAKGEPRDWHSKLAVLRHFRSEFDQGKEFVYGIFAREGDAVIGGTGLHARAGATGLEIGYWIRKSRQNEGLATEVTRALVKTAFELAGVERVQICCDVRNAASVRVIGKVGFREEGIQRHRQQDADGLFQDLRTWSILREEYAASPIRGESLSAWNGCGEKIL